MKRFWTFLVVAWVVLAGLLVGNTLPARARPGQLILETTETDFGTIVNTQAVSRTFQVRNGGGRPLEITGTSTSCGCTTAVLDTLHLEAGAVTTLTLTFDPQVHEGATGNFLRKVYVRSNDPVQPEAVLTFRVNVVEAPASTPTP